MSERCIIIENRGLESLRSKELGYLTKFLPQIKNGQPRAVLLTGDNGIGKTFLINEFVNHAKKSNCQTIFFPNFSFNSIEAFYKQLLENFERECNDILSNTLLKINSIYEDKLNWTEHDLKNALNVVKLQTDINPNVTSEQISKSIKSSMKFISRIKPELDGSIDLLSDLLSDPWIVLSSNFGNPADEIFKDALSILRRAESGLDKEPIPLSVYKDVLLNFFCHINNHIKHRDTGIILVIDHFENIELSRHETREDVKFLISELLDYINQNMGMHLMVLLSCSTNKQSQILGGNLYSNFSNKLLLAPLQTDQAISLTKNLIEAKKLNVTGNITQLIYNSAGGNPFWTQRCITYADSIARAIKIKAIDEDFIKQFIPQKIEEILEFQLTLMYSNFTSATETVDGVMKFLATNKEPFSVFTISQRADLCELDVKLIFEELLKIEFLTSSLGEGYRFSHFIIKDFIMNSYKNKDYYNSQLINLLKLFSVIKHQLYNKIDPYDSVRSLKLYATEAKQDSILAQLYKFLDVAVINENPDIRMSALKGLKAIDIKISLPSIMKVINDQDLRVRKEALNAIEHLLLTFEPEGAVLDSIITALKTSMFDKDYTLRLKAIDIIGKIKSKSTFDALQNLLKDKDENVRALALKYLGRYISEEHYYIFLSKMTDPSGMVRVAAAEQLGKLKARQSLQALCRGLEDPNRAVRNSCAKALGKLGYPEVADSLITALNEPDEEVKLNIIKSLGMLRNKVAIPHFKAILQNPNTDVIYWTTTRALGNIPCIESLEILDVIANNNNNIIQHAALYSLQKIKVSLN